MVSSLDMVLSWDVGDAFSASTASTTLESRGTDEEEVCSPATYQMRCKR